MAFGWLTPLLIVSDILSSGAERNRQAKQSKAVAKIIDEELARFPEATQAIGNIYDTRSDILSSQKGRELGRQTERTGQNVYDFMESYRGAYGTSGFEGSGAFERGMGRFLEKSESEHFYNIESIYDLFAEKDIENLIEKERRLGELEAQKTNLLIQKAGLSAKGGGFLGSLGETLGF